MKILVVAEPKVLDTLKEELLPLLVDYTEVHKNTYLTKLEPPESENSICFGYYYTAVPEHDNRWNGGMVCDLLIEIGTNQMEFLSKNYVRLEEADIDRVKETIDGFAQKEWKVVTEAVDILEKGFKDREKKLKGTDFNSKEWAAANEDIDETTPLNDQEEENDEER